MLRTYPAAMLKTFLLTTVALLMCGACSGKKKPSASKPVSSTSATDASASATNEPALPGLEITIWPKHWNLVLSAASEVSGVPLEVLSEELSSPYAPLEAALRATRINLALPMPMAGIDEARAYTISLTPPEVSFEAVAAAAMAKEELPAARFVRLRISLPASEVDALAKVFSDVAQSAQARAIAQMYVTPEMALRITRHDKALTVDFISGSNMPDQEAELKAAFGPAPSAPAKEALSIATPSALRAIARAQELAELGTATGMSMVMGAVESYEGERQHLLLAEGSAEVLSGFLLMDPDLVLSSVAMLDVPATATGKVQLALAVAAPVREALKAAKLQDGASPLLSEIDWAKVAGAIPNASVFGETASSADLAELFHECGWACFGHLPFASGVQMLGALDRDKKLDDSIANLERLSGKRMPHARLEGDLLVIGQEDVINAERWQKLSYDAVPVTTSEANRCYRGVALQVRQALKGLVGADPSQYSVLIAEARTSLEGARTCTVEEPRSAQRLDALHALIVGLSARVGK